MKLYKFAIVKRKVYHFFGKNNSVVRELFKRNNFEEVRIYDKEELDEIVREDNRKRLHFDTDSIHVVLYTWGLLIPKRFIDQKFSERIMGYIFNFMIPVTLIEKLNTVDITFNFIYISSESAKKGSFDANYAAQKAATEMFIRECNLLNSESLVVAVAPSMIGDAGMTLRRLDTQNVEKAKRNHPKGALLKTEDLVDLIEFLIFQNTYISNTTLEINGGKFSRMHY